MGFDLRMPIGMLFSLFGILLIGYGAATQGNVMYSEHSLGLNINVWWGGALLAFGLVMLALTRLRRKE
jgi:TRAP-type C4-dicarboxylate transport system permease small subunit